MSGTSVEDLRPGDHACLTFSDSDERLDIVAAFVRDGLRAGEKVVCLTESLSPSALAEELTSRGFAPQADGTGPLHILGAGEFFVPEGEFDSGRAIGALRAQIELADRTGYHGLRVTSDMCWALRPFNGAARLMEYESQLTRILAQENATAVCQYDRQCFDTVTLATAAEAHGATVAAITYHDDPMLRICRQHVPTGVRVAGEIDYRAAEPLTRAMTEALALDDHIDVNLTRLVFLDTVAAGVIVQSAVGLTSAQRMTVRCAGMPYKILSALGLRDIAGVTLMAVAHGD
ncbi:MEDS domain-containing protein [Catellatospora sp. KI3]|uniref:MEDS domain-containing protein n=1 Tax=Catellatospora sp. KI3 TaxID=3041620 RepID=UPI00248227A4|nr:MEDS domain-containing protein [Catellatospora sp. KI3]MDI1460217.1 MEDS domain-containing protein [Catellatospora sp. KI3]